MLSLAVHTPADYGLSVTAVGEQAIRTLSMLIALIVLCALLFALVTH